MILHWMTINTSSQVVTEGSTSLGPKLSRGAEVQDILRRKVTSFTEKAKSFVLGEINETLGSVAKMLEMEESMLLLDWDAAAS